MTNLKGYLAEKITLKKIYFESHYQRMSPLKIVFEGALICVLVSW